MIFHRISTQDLTLIMVGCSLIPRLFTNYALKSGTIHILLFWLLFLVLLSEYVSEYAERKKPFFEFPKLTQTGFLIIVFLTIGIFLNRSDLYDQKAFGLHAYLRSSIYLINPLICIILLPLVKSGKTLNFLSLVVISTSVMLIAIKLPTLMERSSFSFFVNQITARFSALMIQSISAETITAESVFFGGSNFSIEVRSGCSPFKQMSMAVHSLLVFFMCVRLKSKVSFLIVIIIGLFVTFVTNSMRISLLAFIVKTNNESYFDFWHNGVGSLTFSIISMFSCSMIYYFFWNNENN